MFADAIASSAPATARDPAAGGPRLRGEEARRRLTYLMLFRVALITLVMGATIVLAWLADVDLASPHSLTLFAIIGGTYVLTLVYALILHRVRDPRRLAFAQLGADLVVTSLLVHVTGGAFSGYTFLFPLSIIGAATVRYRAGAVAVAVGSIVALAAVCLLGYAHWLPTPVGQRILPWDGTWLELSRALALNMAGLIAVALLAVNLGDQIQRMSASLESEQTAVADLYALHEDIVRSLSSGLITVDAGNRVLSVNQAGADILGEPDTLVGRPVEDALPQLAPLLASLGEVESLRRGEIRAGEDGALVLGVSVTPLLNHNGDVRGRIINYQDLTELRRMEVSVRQAERLAAVGTLAAGIAHELRNPLAAISGSIELLRDAAPGGEDASALMGIVTREVERLDSLVNDLLDYTNPRPRQVAPFDLARLVDETLRVFGRDRGLGTVDVRVAEGSLEVGLAMVADAGKLRQVLWNLLRNAAEAAARGGGHVTVRTARSEDGGEAILAVEDDGPGIPREQLDRVFEPFFTTKSRGSGLGLATCQAIVSEHAGAIEVESKPGVGSCFTVRLPLAKG